LTQPITSNIEFLRLISSVCGTFKDKEEDDDDGGGDDDNHWTQKRQQRAGSAGACERGRERRAVGVGASRATGEGPRESGVGGLREAPNFKFEGPIDILSLGIEVPIQFRVSQTLKEPSVFMKELWIFRILILNYFFNYRLIIICN
jgi:hypothetical protein